MAAEDRPSEIREVGFKQRSTVIGAVIMHGASDLSVGGPKAVIVTETHNSESTQEYTEILLFSGLAMDVRYCPKTSP